MTKGERETRKKGGGVRRRGGVTKGKEVKRVAKE